MGSSMRSKTLDVAISETLDETIVDHADRLHVCVDHGRSDEAECAALEIAAESIGLGGGRGNLAQSAPAILPGRPANAGGSAPKPDPMRIRAFQEALRGSAQHR